MLNIINNQLQIGWILDGKGANSFHDNVLDTRKLLEDNYCYHQGKIILMSFSFFVFSTVSGFNTAY